MDLNEILDKSCEISNDILINCDLAVPDEKVNNCGQIDTDNKAPDEAENHNYSNKDENFLFFYINTQKSFDENVDLVEILKDPCFLRLLDVKNQEGKILMIYEKPEFTLLTYLLNNKEEIYGRFLLFKQSLEIIFKLISLEEKFSYFNYSIFFVEENLKNNLKYGQLKIPSEHSVKLKIFYHGKILFFL